METKISFKNSQGEILKGVLHQPKKPQATDGQDNGIVFLHCFTCTKYHRIVRSLSEQLCEAGFIVLRFDFSGNGESEGRLEDATYTKMIGEVKEAVTLLNKRGIRRIGLAGHSMGAILVLLSASSDPRVSAVAFLAGSSEAARVRHIFPPEVIETTEREGVSEAFVYGRTIMLKREFLLDVENYNAGLAAATLKRPILLVHGTADEVINFYHARQLYNWASQPKTLVPIEGADHLFRDDAALRQLSDVVVGWFLKTL